MADWIAAQILSSAHKRAARDAARVGLLSFVPLFWRAGKERLLFPGYMFIHAPRSIYFLESEVIYGIVGIGGLPLRSDDMDAKIDELRSLRDDRGHVPAPFENTRRRNNFLRRGDRIKVVSGAFCGMLGSFERMRRGSAQVALDKMLSMTTLIRLESLAAA